MNIQLRLASTADCDLLAGMNRELIVDEGGHPPSQIELSERMRRWLKEGWTAVLILTNKIAVGYILFQQRPNAFDPQQAEVYIRQYFVKRPFRGKGIGQAAWALIQAEYFPAGTTLALDVLATNAGARRFWERQGFQSAADSLRLEKRN